MFNFIALIRTVSPGIHAFRGNLMCSKVTIQYNKSEKCDLSA